MCFAIFGSLSVVVLFLGSEFLLGLAWGFLVLQLIVYVFRAVPVKLLQCGRVEYGCGTEPNGYTVPVFCMRVWHADAMKTMASLNRMVLVLDGQTEYAINRAYFKLLSDPKQNPFNFFHILKMDMRFMLFDAFFVNLLLNGAKLQFQTSYWALLMYANLDARCSKIWFGMFPGVLGFACSESIGFLDLLRS